jgi:hypothetical protein
MTEKGFMNLPYITVEEVRRRRGNKPAIGRYPNPWSCLKKRPASGRGGWRRPVDLGLSSKGLEVG